MPFQWGGVDLRFSGLICPLLTFIALSKWLMTGKRRAIKTSRLVNNSRIRVHGILEIECLTDQ